MKTWMRLNMPETVRAWRRLRRAWVDYRLAKAEDKVLNLKMERALLDIALAPGEP